MKGKPRGMFRNLREGTGDKGRGIWEGEMVEEMRKK